MCWGGEVREIRGGRSDAVMLGKQAKSMIMMVFSTPSGPYLNTDLALFLWSIIKYRGIPF